MSLKTREGATSFKKRNRRPKPSFRTQLQVYHTTAALVHSACTQLYVHAFATSIGLIVLVQQYITAVLSIAWMLVSTFQRVYKNKIAIDPILLFLFSLDLRRPSQQKAHRAEKRNWTMWQISCRQTAAVHVCEQELDFHLHLCEDAASGVGGLAFLLCCLQSNRVLDTK